MTGITIEECEMGNGLAWFLMDAFWMLQWNSLCLIAIAPTLLTGLAAIWLEKSRPLKVVNLAIFMWMMMNTFWLLSDIFKNPKFLILSRASFVLGSIVLIIACITNKDFRAVFSRFKRFRFFHLAEAITIKRNRI